MTKNFIKNIRRIWRTEGFKIIDAKVKPINDKTVQWTITGEIID